MTLVSRFRWLCQHVRTTVICVNQSLMGVGSVTQSPREISGTSVVMLGGIFDYPGRKPFQ